MQADPPTPAAAPAPVQVAGPSTTSFDRTPVAPAFSGNAGTAVPAATSAAGVTGAGRLTAYTTGAYQPSGDVYIDRMLRLEAALKRNGGGF